jgi:hypothetical protein
MTVEILAQRLDGGRRDCDAGHWASIGKRGLEL